MQKWNMLPLKTKMFLTFSTVLLFIIGLICSIFYYSNVKEMKRQTQSLSSVLSRQFDRTLELYIQDIERLSVAIFTDPVIQNSLIDRDLSQRPIDEVHFRNNLYPRLFNHAYPRSDVESISIYTKDGTVYDYSKRAQIEVENMKEMEPWTKAVDGIEKDKFLLLPTTFSKMRNGKIEYVISLVRNIYRIPQRNKIGSMKILINVKALENLITLKDQHEIEEHMRVFILTDDGTVIYDNKEWFTGRKNAGFDTSILSNETNIGNVEWQGNKYIYSFEKSNYTNWNTVVLISNEFILAEQNKILKYIFIIGLFSTSLIALISYLLSHHITLPLRKMITTMERVEQGKLNERMNLTGNAETDLLGRVYNNMLDSINRLIKEVYESKLTENNAKISALQSQINPHFLYNTLNIMKSISRIKGVEEVAEISESLADLFKYSMKHLKHPVALSEEIEHVRNYMKIQHHRFGNRFKLICDIPDNLMDASIPKLTIQPLIENAVEHGLSNLHEGGLIRLNIRNDGDILVIHISDNGEGIEPDSLNNILKRLSSNNVFDDEANGIGLTNIQQRIQLLYGSGYRFMITSPEGEGVIVKFEIPYIPFPQKKGMKVV